jgi:hypothetical protein
MGTQATPASEPAEIVEEGVDELSGEELFDIPEDLLDEPDTGAPAGGAADASKEEPPAAEPAADTLQLPEGYKRDARGAVHRPDGTIASKSELDSFVPAQPAAKPAADAQPAQPAAGAPAGQAAEPAVEAPVLELSFRADGKPVTIPGSKLTDDGAFIPKDYLPEVQRLLSRGVTYEGSFRQRLETANAEVARVKSEVHREIEESKAFLTFFADLLERGPVAVQDWLDDFEKNKPQLEAEAKIAYAEALTAAKQNPAAPAKVEGFDDDQEDDFLAGVDRDEMMTQLSNVLGQNLREVIVTNGIRGLSDADVNRLHQAIASDPEEMERYFAIANEDIPDMKVAKGDVLVRQAALLKRVQYEATVLGGARKSVSEATAAAEANKKRAPGGAPPPTASVAGGVTQKKKEVPIPTKREDLDAYMAADD